MQDQFYDTLMYTNREQRRKCERYMEKHKCSFLEAYNAIYGTDYKYSYNEKKEILNRNTYVNNNRKSKGIEILDKLEEA